MRYRIEPFTKKAFELFCPRIDNFDYYNFVKSNPTMLDMYIKSGLIHVLYGEDPYPIMIGGKILVSHNTAEVAIMMGVQADKHMLQCIRVMKKQLTTYLPPSVVRLEISCPIHNKKSFKLATKCLGFSIVGIRSKFGLNNTDCVLLEKVIKC